MICVQQLKWGDKKGMQKGETIWIEISKAAEQACRRLMVDYGGRVDAECFGDSVLLRPLSTVFAMLASKSTRMPVDVLLQSPAFFAVPSD
jgi:hypothetical protein